MMTAPDRDIQSATYSVPISACATDTKSATGHQLGKGDEGPGAEPPKMKKARAPDSAKLGISTVSQQSAEKAVCRGVRHASCAVVPCTVIAALLSPRSCGVLYAKSARSGVRPYSAKNSDRQAGDKLAA